MKSACSLELLVMRHGETEDNRAGIIQGQSRPGRLTAAGKKQATKMAAFLLDKQLDALYTSDLARAVATAKIIMKGRSGTEFILDRRLREQCFGVYEGAPFSQMAREMRRQKVSLLSFNPPGGEAASAFQTRVTGFLKEIICKHRGGLAALVTHTNVINVLLSMFSYPGCKVEQLADGLIIKITLG